MKTAKLIIGIVSIVVFMIIIFQSCAAGIVGAIEGGDDTSGAGGMLLAFTMLIGGIVGLVTRNSKGGGITAGAFYLLGAIIGFANAGIFTDLIIWSIIALIFGVFFIVSSILMKKPVKNMESDTNA